MLEKKCSCCDQYLPLSHYYSHHVGDTNIFRFSNKCVRCIKTNIENVDVEKTIEICKELDIPYITKEWNSLVKAYPNEKIIGRYIFKMQTKNFENYTFADSVIFNEVWSKKNS